MNLFDWTPDRLREFESEVARRYEAGEIHAPVHLSGGNEERLIDIFKNIKRTDWVFSTWRSHYQALLHGIPPEEVMRQILAGKSMSINSVDPPFYASSIAGGIVPIAMGAALAIKRKKEEKFVWCFVGDMVGLMGIFRECTRYAWNFGLPITFVVEDNGKSVQTDTRESWGIEKKMDLNTPFGGIPVQEKFPPNVEWYRYKLGWPHHGTGKFVQLPF